MTEDSVPDIYADSITVTAGNYGFTLTLHVGDPDLSGAADAQPTNRMVGRVRISPDLAGALARTLIQANTARKEILAQSEDDDGNRELPTN